ncbi:beta strand repeat-containing protein [Candidatus Spyradosoma sp. SGI.093]|uniref:beta strand repeat-containing protein n=1 Tax=Candidatus Spyradosoma sp. SGI.093 TaxID=3420583 RepID=UPI003D01FD08
MKTKRLFISTLIAAAAMGLSAYANEAATQTTHIIAETDAPEGADQILPLADAPAAEDADAPAAEEAQDEADALELLLADDALVELDEAAAPDELSTETMMREWIARYAAAARFAGIRAVKGTGGGLSSGGALATAGAELAVPAATPTPSVSVPAAGTVSLADTLTRASIAADVSLGSSSASDAGTPAAVATTSSSSGASAILPAAFFSTRGVFAAVPAATASYSLASSSPVAAAAMSANASGAEYTISTSGDPRLTSATADDTIIFNLASGHLNGDRNATRTVAAAVRIDRLNITDGYSGCTYVFNNTVTGTGAFSFGGTTGANNQKYTFNGDVSGYSGAVTIASGKYATLTFTNKTGTGTITATNASSVLNLTGATVNNSAISVSTVNIGGATSFVKTTDLNSGNIVLASGAAMNIASTGALDLSSSTLNASNGTVSIATDGSLDLSGARVSLGSAIQNLGTVTVSAATVFNLTQTGTTRLISGGTINGWDSLTSSNNFTYNGAAITVGRQLTSSEAGVVSYDASATAKTLTWTGAGSSVWKAVTIAETSPATPWQDNSSSTAEAFYNGDSVTFSGDATVTVAAGGVTAGTVNITAGTVSFTGGTITALGGVSVTGGTLSVGANNTALGTNTITLSGGTLLAASATGTLANAVNVAAASIIDTQGNTLTLSGAVSGSGTLTKQGAGTLKLATGFGGTGDTRWTAGNLVVGSGTLQWGQGDTNPAIANQMKALGETISVSSGANLKIHLWTQTRLTTSTTDKVAVTSKIILNGTSTLETMDGSYYFSGGIQVGDGTNAGTGTFTANWRKGHVIGSLSGAGTFTINEQAGNDDRAAIFSIAGDGGFNGTVNFNYKSGGSSAGAELHLLTENALKNATVNLTSAVSEKTATLSLDAATVNIKGLTGTSAGRVVAATAGNTLAIATETGATNTFWGTVGTSSSAVGLSVSGSGTQAFTGTSYFSTVSVGAGATLDLSGTVNIAGTTTVGSGGTLDVSGGNVTFGGAFTTEGSAKLVLGTLSADTAAILATGAVTISGGTIFDMTDAIDMTEASASLKLVAGSSVVADGLGIANIYVGGKLVNQRGIARFSVSDAGVLTLDSYTAGVNYSLTWTGGDADVWKVNGSGWTKDEGSTAENFQDGDSVTFSIAGAQVSVDGTVNPEAIAVSANTTFKGTGATVNVAKNSLTISGGATLEIQKGVTLDLGSDSDAIGSSNAKLNLSGSGTVKYVYTGNNGTDSGVFIADSFTGTLDYYGNLNWSQYEGGSPISFSDSVTIRLSKSEGQTSAGFWGGSDRTFKNDFIFGTDYDINVGGGSLRLEGAVDAAGKTLTVKGGNTLTFAGAATVGTLNQTAGTLDISGTEAKNITNLTLAGTRTNISGNLAVSSNISVCNAATVTQTAGTVSAVRLLLNDSNATKASSYTLQGGVLNITGTGKTDSTTENAILIGHWPDTNTPNNTSKLTVSGGTLNALSGYTLVSWDGKGELEISDGTANLYAISLNSQRANAATVTLSGGRLNLGQGGLIVGTALNETVTLSGGTLGALANWTSAMNMRVTGAVTIDTTKQVVRAEGISANADGNVGSAIELSGELSGAGTLTVKGTGKLTLSGANSYTGGTTIENGTLVAGSASALGSGPVTAAGSTGVDEVTLKVGASADAALTIENDISVSSGKTLILESTNADNKLMGTISGENGALKLASGTLEIAGASSLKLVKVGDGAVLKFSGETTSIVDSKDGALVDGGGKLVFSSETATVSRILLNTWYGDSSGNAIPSTASALAEVSGGIVNVTSSSQDGAISIGSGASTHSHTLTISGGVLNATAGTTTLGYSSAGTLAVAGGEANLKGVVFGLSGVNSAGTLKVSGGRLNVGESGITSGGGSGTKTISFSDATIGALDSWSSAAGLGISLTGAVIFDTTKMVASTSESATASTTDTAGTTITLAGALSGSGTLTKVGAGTLKLTGDNSAFTGNVKLSAGTLEIGHSNALGSSTSTLNVTGDSELKLGSGLNVTNSIIFMAENAVTLTVNAAVDTEFSGAFIPIDNSNIVRKVGAGTLTLSGNNEWFSRGTISVEEGTVLAAQANALGKGKVTVGADGKLGIAAGVTITEVSGGIELANGAKIVVDLSDRLSETATFEVTLATNTAISLAAEAALAYSEGGAMDLTDYLELKGWNKSGWTSSLTYANETLTLTMAIPEPSLFGLLAGVTALGFSMSSRRRRKKA